jgi:hypothetical protein
MSQQNQNVFGGLDELFGSARDIIISGADVARDIGIISDETYEGVERRFQAIDTERQEYENDRAAEKFNNIWSKTWPLIATAGIVFAGLFLLRKL